MGGVSKQASNALVAIRKTLEKKYKDSTELFPDFRVAKKIPVIKTRSAILNSVLGVGGIPKGRVTEVFGPESTGKTTLAIDLSVSQQQADPESTILYIDYEHAFDASYARALGLNLDPDRFVFAQPECLEQGVDIIYTFLESNLVDLVVIDSMAAMTPRSEMEGNLDDKGPLGEQARLVAKFLTKVTKILPRGRKPALLVINQTRMKIDIKNPRNTGEDSAGGKALRFYSSVRLMLEVAKKEGESGRGSKGTDQVYTQNLVRVTAVKNKVAPPWVRGMLVLEYGKGINHVASVAELAEAKMKIMAGAGFFHYEGDKPETSFSCRGREAFLELLMSNPAILEEIQGKVIQIIKEEHARMLGLSGQVQIVGEAKEIEEVTVLEGSQSKDSQMSLSGGLPIIDEDEDLE